LLPGAAPVRAADPRIDRLLQSPIGKAGFELSLQQLYRAEFGIAAEDAAIFVSLSAMASLWSPA
jgi:hypothetical protein